MDKQRSKVLSIDVIDDDIRVRQQLRRWIEPMDSVTLVSEYARFDDALSGLAHYTPELVVVEFGLRGGNGLAMVGKLRQQHPATRLLVFTAHDEHLYAERALRAGAHGYLMKPADEATFGTAVTLVLSGQLYVSPAIELKILQDIACQDEQQSALPDKVLSNRELEVFIEIGRGRKSRSIAEQLGLSLKTVETHRTHIKRKLGIRSAVELRKLAAQWAEEQGAVGR